MIDDADIEAAVERLERELGELRLRVDDIRSEGARISDLLEALLRETQLTNRLLERLSGQKRR